MRKKPLRGEKVDTLDNMTYTVLDTTDVFVRVLNEDGKILSIEKSKLALPVIDTACYEHIK